MIRMKGEGGGLKRWGAYSTVHSPLFFRKIVEIERFALLAAIFNELGGGGGLGGSYERPSPSVHVKIKMAVIDGKTRYI